MTGKKAIVTGGSAGIGKRLRGRLLAKASVSRFARHKAQLEEIATEISKATGARSSRPSRSDEAGRCRLLHKEGARTPARRRAAS
jgi:NAD(P)-dependent dehydrogenase (short-subunit alcohol dehydrogenase family)